jgi:hypothetical protein
MSWTLALAFHEQRTSERAHAILDDSDIVYTPWHWEIWFGKRRNRSGHGYQW